MLTNTASDVIFFRRRSTKQQERSIMKFRLNFHRRCSRDLIFLNLLPFFTATIKKFSHLAVNVASAHSVKTATTYIHLLLFFFNDEKAKSNNCSVALLNYIIRPLEHISLRTMRKFSMKFCPWDRPQMHNSISLLTYNWTSLFGATSAALEDEWIHNL